MGHTRDDRQAPGLGTSDPSTAYVGRRRASISAPESGTPATPYVGRRRAATPTLELHGAETEAYLHGLSAEVPSVYVVMRDAETDGPVPYEVLLITASPYEAQDYTDSGEEIVEKVPMPHGLVAWVREFVEDFPQDEVFVKRRRDRTRVDLVQDGVGDPRIGKPADIYASPALKRRRLS